MQTLNFGSSTSRLRLVITSGRFGQASTNGADETLLYRNLRERFASSGMSILTFSGSPRPASQSIPNHERSEYLHLIRAILKQISRSEHQHGITILAASLGAELLLEALQGVDQLSKLHLILVGYVPVNGVSYLPSVENIDLVYGSTDYLLVLTPAEYAKIKAGTLTAPQGQGPSEYQASAVNAFARAGFRKVRTHIVKDAGHLLQNPGGQPSQEALDLLAQLSIRGNEYAA